MSPPMLKGEAFAERFRRKIDYHGPVPEHMPHLERCWTWTGTHDQDGYGVASRAGKRPKAHRVAWEIENGAIPEGQYVCHRCDRRDCVRPSHLFLGDNAANMADMAAKGRGVRGDLHWTRRFPERLNRGPGSTAHMTKRGIANSQAKLTDDQVRAIRREYVPRRVSAGKLAERYGVSRRVVWLILRRKAWTHVE